MLEKGGSVRVWKKSRKTKSELKKRNALITESNPKSPISEQFRNVRTNLQYASIDEDVSVIMTTSSGPGEGKSTVNSNVAVSIAQQGKKVLVIDADLRKPTVHYIFQTTNQYGLSNSLTSPDTLTDSIKKTKVEGLEVLTSGPIPPNPSELLGSNRMKTFIASLKETYDYIILDTPPLLAVTDAQILAGLCDGVILVVSSKQTTKEEAAKAKELLKHTNAKILGGVLNRQDKKAGNYMYYYGQ
ncbi:CpsD/CapB family tyrosine-protein kinase [Alteribacillus sp. JSM 102045]|uniref:CpsD/CapB family tyrosine-protein kinase n=1 Tax=Alteribacillus sp. JSM 102045 TaxID=1562101 RepID=UPI0035C1AB87